MSVAFEECQFPVAARFRSGYEKRIQEGLRYVGGQRVVMACLVPNSLSGAREVLKRLEQTGRFFEGYETVVLTEGSSNQAHGHNRLRRLSLGLKADYVILADASASWSYDGVVHTFGYHGLWDGVTGTRNGPRGTPLIPHSGGLQGLGIYRREAWCRSFYDGSDDECHELFHRHMRENGLRVLQNPSLIIS